MNFKNAIQANFKFIIFLMEKFFQITEEICQKKENLKEKYIF